MHGQALSRKQENDAPSILRDDSALPHCPTVIEKIAVSPWTIIEHGEFFIEADLINPKNAFLAAVNASNLCFSGHS
jgi:hypothetical protein